MLTDKLNAPSLLTAALAVLLILSAGTAAAQVEVEPVEALTPDELTELVAPIALYPDDLVAVVLPASTYPLQVVAAARYRNQAETDSNAEPDETWDESVVALLNYPEALDLLNEDLDWTWSLGQAVTTQQPEVLKAITDFRLSAVEAGNLASDDHQEVVVGDDIVTIKSRDPETVYVPYYDPEEVTVRHVRRVYHYYPTAYPLYYYPYSYGHYFYDDYPFWGVSSIFVLSWSDYHLYHRLHSHHLHPYYRHRYHTYHFRRTHHYHAPSSYERRHRRHQRHARQAPWRPNREYTGARPYLPGYRDGDRLRHRRFDRQLDQPRDHRQREHARRLQRNTLQSIDSSKLRRQQLRDRSSVHREPRRELSTSPERSDVHRLKDSGQIRQRLERYKRDEQRPARVERREHIERSQLNPLRQQQSEQSRPHRLERRAQLQQAPRMERRANRPQRAEPAQRIARSAKAEQPRPIQRQARTERPRADRGHRTPGRSNQEHSRSSRSAMRADDRLQQAR